MTAEEYRKWFDTLSEKTRNDVIRIWGEPPGEAMVRDGRILITGVSFGNALIMVQPKRGCYGPKCDGTVCRVLHDPVCPPTHQYLATYHWLDSVWGADAVVHNGTHGILEVLPGKGVGLTPECYPEIAIGTMPHLYFFDAGSVPPATAAKRRGYATLIDHLPPASALAKPYGPIEELRVALEQYDSAKDDPLRAEEYRKHIVRIAIDAGLDEKDLSENKDLGEIVKLCTEEYSRVTGTRIQIGMHVIGSELDLSSKASIIASVMAYGKDSICRRLASAEGIDYAAAEAEPEKFNEAAGKPNALVTSKIYDECVSIIEDVLKGKECTLGPSVEDDIREMAQKIDDSDEIGPFMNSLSGGYVEPGPCGLITKGRKEILPTGIRFYMK